VRCALAVLLATLCLRATVTGLGHILSGVLFARPETALGTGGLVDYGIIAQHHVTRQAIMEWVQYHLAAAVGLCAAIIYLSRPSPGWLARVGRSIP
jgi:hypothetical protein